jgi:hypothetical protein
VSALTSQQNSGISGYPDWDIQAIREGSLPYIQGDNGSWSGYGAGFDALLGGFQVSLRIGSLPIGGVTGWPSFPSGGEMCFVLLDQHQNVRMAIDSGGQSAPVFFSSLGAWLGYPAYTTSSWW